jgi:tetratricopeptide (TPR) repeat protein
MIRIVQALGLVFLLFCVACHPRPGVDTTIPELPAFITGYQADTSSRILEALTEAVEDYSRSPDAWFQRANWYLSRDNWKEALQDVDQAIRLDRNNSAYHFVKALALQRMGDSKMAWESAQQAEKLNHQSSKFFLLMGELWQEKNNYEQSQRYLEKALEINPSDGEIYYFKARVATEKGDTAQARRWFEQALTKRPDYLDTYIRLAELANRSGQPYKSIRYLREGLRQDSAQVSQRPGKSTFYAQLYYQAGNAYRNLDNPDTAKYLYNQAVKFNPELYQAMYQAGVLYFNDKNYPEARRRLEAAEKGLPELPRINYYLGICQLQDGELIEAHQRFKAARLLDPSDYKVSEQLKKTGWLVYLQDKKRRDDSLSAILPSRRVQNYSLEPLAPIVPKVLQVPTDTSRIR